jgi:predicted phosphodiesterase
MPVVKDCSNLPSNSDAGEISSSNKTGNQIVGKQSLKLTSRKKMKHKILIIGDSHRRECASNVKYNLENDFEVQGVINSGAGLKEITNSVKNEIKLLTKKDVAVVWGGTSEVGKNETINGLNQIKEFIKKNNHTNIIQMCVRHRFDLQENSCVNNEIEVFNRRLSKMIKIFDHTVLQQTDSSRELFTEHGLHMNKKGKKQKQAAEKIAAIIKHILHDKIKEPICLTWKEDVVNKSQEKQNIQAHEGGKNNLRSTREKMDSEDGSALLGDRCLIQNQVTTPTKPLRKRRKPPSTRRDDFLWLGDSKI